MDFDTASPVAFMQQLEEMEDQTRKQQEQLEDLQNSLDRKKAEEDELHRAIQRITTQRSAHEAHVTQLSETLILLEEKAAELRERLGELDETLGLVGQAASAATPSSKEEQEEVSATRHDETATEKQLLHQKASSLFTVFFTLPGAYRHRHTKQNAIAALLDCWENRTLLGGGLILKNVFPISITTAVDEPEHVRRGNLCLHYAALPLSELGTVVQQAVECVAEEAQKLERAQEQ